MKSCMMLITASLCSVALMAAVPKQIELQRLSPRSAKVMKVAKTEKADEMVSAYITVDPAALDRDALARLGVTIGMDLGTTLTARLSLSVIDELQSVEGVEYVQVSTPVKQMLDVARPEIQADKVNSGQSLPKPYTGAGVIVGIVDSGFDYGHAAFRDANGNLRIKRVWEQTAIPTGNYTAPARFGYGIELTEAADILDAEGDIRNNSHGSHVASLAAGSDFNFGGVLSGMAPDADIVLVSMVEAGGGNVNISDAIAYIFDYADEVGKPCVVNLSLGSSSGPHDGTSTFDVIADRLQGPGRLIVGAVGNGRGIVSHLRKDFNGADDAPLMSFFEYTAQYDKTQGDEIDLWADKGMDIEVSLLAYKVSSKSEAERVKIYPNTESSTVIAELGRNISGCIRVDSEISPLNGKVHLLLSSEITSVRTGYAVALEVKPLAAGAVDVWSVDGNINFISHDIEGFTACTDEPTVCEIGGTAKRILSVGAYTTRKDYIKLGETVSSSMDETVGQYCSFSGNGPTADGRVKPQICAPGCYISAAVSSFDNSGTKVLSQYFNKYGRDHFYGFMQGTSMATPIVTGVVATWLEAWPEMTPEDLLDVVKATARTDEFTGTLSTPDNDWGYGKIDALGGVRECITRAQSGGISSVIVDSQRAFSLCGYVADGSILLLSSCDNKDVTIDVYSILGERVSHNIYGDVAASDIITVPMASLERGNYIVNVVTSAGSYAFKVVR